MVKQAPHLIPSIYLANYLNEFEDIIRKYDVHEKKMGKGEYLTRYGVINNTAFFIKNGIIHLSLGHDQGKKSLNFFGTGTVFPVGVEIHEFRVEYEMILQAMTDIDVYTIPYPTLKRIAQENGELPCLKRLPELTNEMVCVLKNMETMTITYKLSVTNLEFTGSVTRKPKRYTGKKD